MRRSHRTSVGTDPRLVEALETYLARIEDGEVPNRESVLRRHPDLAGALEPCLDALDFIHDSTGGSGGRLRPAGGESELSGQTLGDFRVRREVGRGGMAVVYEAEQVSLDRRVALKVLPFAAVLDPTHLQRFRNEARAAAHLHHTHIVPIYAVGCERGVHYQAMQFIEGPSLAEVVEELRAEARGEDPGPERSPSSSAALEAITKDRSTGSGAYCRAVARLGVQAAEALDHAHSQGIVHRDVKPANLLVDAEGRVWITDFGLASSCRSPGLTLTGDVVGTVRYMSPEQARGKRDLLDHRTDVYSLGATLYEVLTLEPAFRGDDAASVLRRIVEDEPRAPRRLNPAIPRELETIVLKALAKSPVDRYASAEAMADDLRRLLEHRPIRAKRPPMAKRAAKWVRRHKMKAALTGALIAAATIAILLGLSGARERELRALEEARRVELEYMGLCALAEESLVRDLDAGPAASRDFYAKAIALDPGRHEAYLGRALLPGRSPEERLDDVEEAAARGLSPRTAHLFRAWIYRRTGRVSEAEAEGAFAAGLEGEDPDALVLEARLAAARGDRALATELCSRVIDRTALGSSARYRALDHRSRLREADGDLDRALEDLAAFRTARGTSAIWDIYTDVRIASLWRRLGQGAGADSRLSAMLEDFAGDEERWIGLCGAFQASAEHAWLERASTRALRLFPNSAPLLTFRATALSNLEQYDEALRLTERVLTLDPENHRALETRGRALLGLERDEDALAPLRQAIATDPSCAGSQSKLGIALGRLRRYEEALAAHERAIELEPLRAGHHRNRGITLRELGRQDEALEALDHAIEIDAGLVEAHVDRGGVLVALERTGDALVAYGRALDLDREHVIALVNRGNLLVALQRYEEARADFERVLDLDPKSADAHNGRGATFLYTKKYPEAEASFDRALEIDPKHAEAHYNRALVLFFRQRFEAAREAFDRSLELRPECADALFNRGATLAVLGKLEEAIDDFRSVVRIDARYPEAWCRLGHLLERTVRLREALDAHVRAREQEPSRRCSHISIVRLHLLLRQPELAAKAYEAALEHGPFGAPFHASGGLALHTLERYRDAMAVYERAIEVDEEYAPALNNLAMLLATCPDATLRDLARAVRLAERAAKLDARFRGTLGVACYRAGDFERAVEVLEACPAQTLGGDGFFLAMAFWQVSRQEEAREQYDRSVRWMDANPNPPNDEALRRFRAEAAELLGISREDDAREGR